MDHERERERERENVTHTPQFNPFIIAIALNFSISGKAQPKIAEVRNSEKEERESQPYMIGFPFKNLKL